MYRGGTFDVRSDFVMAGVGQIAFRHFHSSHFCIVFETVKVLLGMVQIKAKIDSRVGAEILPTPLLAQFSRCECFIACIGYIGVHLS